MPVVKSMSSEHTAECPHCAETSLQIVKLSTEQKHSDLYRPATGLRVAGNTSELQKCFENVAKLLQIYSKTLSFFFVSVFFSLVWTRPYMSGSPGSEYNTVFSNVTQCSLVCIPASASGKVYVLFPE